MTRTNINTTSNVTLTGMRCILDVTLLIVNADAVIVETATDADAANTATDADSAANTAQPVARHVDVRLARCGCGIKVRCAADILLMDGRRHAAANTTAAGRCGRRWRRTRCVCRRVEATAGGHNAANR